MSCYGIASNLVVYLTKMLHEGTVTSANNVTDWVGTVRMTPILGAYIADAHLGRYWTSVIASAIYLSVCAESKFLRFMYNQKLGKLIDFFELDVGNVTFDAFCFIAKAKTSFVWRKCVLGSTCSNKTASVFQKGVFYTALYIIAIGTGGTKPNISTIGADQFDDFEPNERTLKLSFFNWWMFSIFSGTLFANTVLVYLQDNVGWTLGYGLPMLGLAFSIMLFLVVGTEF